MQQTINTLVFLGVIIMAGICLPVTAAELQIVLKEHVNRQWTNELLSYPFEAPEGACHPDSLSLQGPAGPKAMQLSDVKYWPATRTIKSATLWLVADLSPLAADAYTINYQATPVDGQSVRGDLAVTSTPDRVEMNTSHFGARLLLGRESYDEAKPASEVPGPVMAMRLADGLRMPALTLPRRQAYPRTPRGSRR